MGRFNKPKTKKMSASHHNRAGGESFKQSKRLAFISILLSSFLGNKYYRSADSEMEELANFVKKDPKFAAKGAIYARNEYGMRSVTHVVAAEIAHEVSGKEWPKYFFSRVVYRVDDMMEILAYYLDKYGKPIPKNLRKGFRHAFNKFDNYQIAKYKKSSAEISLVDVVNIVHPYPTDRNKEALKKLVNGNLGGAKTWETGLTQAGNDEKEKEQVWYDLLESGKLGYFATLRNLRNIAQQAPDALDMALNIITDKERIEKTLVMPFRYTTAMDAIDEMNSSVKSKIKMALSEAVDKSLRNVPSLEGKTAVLLDDSGSMQGHGFGRMKTSNVIPIEIGSLFASVLVKSNDADLVMFSSDARHVAVNKNDSVMTIRDQLMQNIAAAGTDFGNAIDILDKKYDRIIILSDMQAWERTLVGGESVMAAYKNYRNNYNVNPKLYSWDLNGYGDMQFPEKDVFCLAGWSDKVFDMMQMLEDDSNTLVNAVENIDI